MDIVEEVLIESKKLNEGINNCTINFGEFYYPRDERRKLISALTNRIAPLLESNGFIKKNNCFFRAYGDALLQIIGVVYPHNVNFYTASIVQPLYDFFQPLSDKYTQIHDLIGLRNNRSPDEARPIEFALGLCDRKILSVIRNHEKAFDTPSDHLLAASGWFVLNA